LRDGFAKMIAFPICLAEPKRRERDVDSISGPKLTAMAKKAVNQAPEIIESKRILRD
jgi:hypothetical protein